MQSDYDVEEIFTVLFGAFSSLLTCLVAEHLVVVVMLQIQLYAVEKIIGQSDHTWEL